MELSRRCTSRLATLWKTACSCLALCPRPWRRRFHGATGVRRSNLKSLTAGGLAAARGSSDSSAKIERHRGRKKMSDDNIPRRSFLKGAGAAGTAVATALSGALPTPAQAQTTPAVNTPPASPPAAEAFLTLTATEAAFLSAAYDAFIPADRLSPSGTDCGLVVFIDRQLAGAWGGGARLYRGGPFIKGTREQGYQLSLTPREYFAAGIKATNAWTRKAYGKDFDRLAPPERDAALKAMDAGKAELAEIDGKQFFELLYAS